MNSIPIFNTQFLGCKALIALFCAAAISLCTVGSVAMAQETIERVSVSSEGNQSGGKSSLPAISNDGRFVVFGSLSSANFDPEALSSESIFMHDRNTGQTIRIGITTDNTGGVINTFPSISANGNVAAYHRGLRSTRVYRYDASTGETESIGAPNNEEGAFSSLSADGRFVAFESYSTRGVYVRDQVNNQTFSVSMALDGTPTYGNRPSISADGRFVVFKSRASNLVPNDTNNEEDIFVYGLISGETTLISVTSDGSQVEDLGMYQNDSPSISASGRYVAFISRSPDLVPNDTNNAADIFVRDRASGQTTRVSVASDGTQAKRWSSNPSISGDGRLVAFKSAATNLAPNDTNNTADIFVHDRETGQTIRVSSAADGTQANKGASNPDISDDGKFVVFASSSSNLVPNDTNEVSDIFVRSVTMPQNASSIQNPGDQTSIEYDSVTLNIMANSSSEAPISFRATGLPPGLSIDANSGTISGSLPIGSVGVYNDVVVYADDGENSAYTIFTWTINYLNNPPTIENPGNQTDAVGDIVNLSILTTDIEQDALTFSATGLPSGLSIDGDSGAIGGMLAADGYGFNTVTVTVEDGANSSSITFDWLVNRAWEVCANNGELGTVQAAVNAAISGDVINICAGTYYENITVVNKNLKLVGAAPTSTILDGQQQESVVRIVSSNVKIENVSITNGAAALGGGIHLTGTYTIVTDDGGWTSLIDLKAPSLAINNSIITDNRAESGGGIYNFMGRLTVKNSTIANSVGGGIKSRSLRVILPNPGGYNLTGATAVADIQNSLFEYNRRSAISSEGVIRVQNSTFLNNLSPEGGAVISMARRDFFYDDDQKQIVHSTFIEDRADAQGKFISAFGASNFSLHNSIFSANGNPELQDCSGLFDLGFGGATQNNIMDVDPTTCSERYPVDSNTFADPLLGAAVDDGTPGGKYFPLLNGSPAIDQADNETCTAFDQRGIARPQGSGCDIGAVEMAENATQILGDVNCDQTVNSVDALFILQHVVDQRSDSGGCPLTDANSLHAAMGDVNGNGEITPGDALFVLQCSVGFSNTLCPGIQAAALMGAEERAAAAEAQRLLIEAGLWPEQNINVFMPLVTR